MFFALLLAAQTAAMPSPQAAPSSAPAPAAPAARLNLDTPVEAIVADAKGKAVLDADLPALTTNASFDMFKAMTLHQLQGYAPDKLTDERLAKVQADLAAIK